MLSTTNYITQNTPSLSRLTGASRSTNLTSLSQLTIQTKGYHIMKTTFTNGPTRYVPGQTFGRETSRGWGRDPKRTLYREWTRWTYSEYHRAWVHDGKTWHTLRATKKQIIAAI